MRNAIRRSLISLVVVSMLFAGVGTASAAFNVTTKLSMRAPKTVERGVLFHIRGKLKSSEKYCRAKSVVVLYKDGKSKVAKKTKNTGKYRFKVKTKKTAKYQVRFEGKSQGVHPDTEICGASQSKIKRVRVTS